MICRVEREMVSLDPKSLTFDLLFQRFKQALKPLGIRPLTPVDIQHVEEFFGPIKKQPGEGLRPVRGRKDKGGQGHSLGLPEAHGMLSRVAEEHRFRVNYLDIETKRPDGEWLSFPFSGRGLGCDWSEGFDA